MRNIVSPTEDLHETPNHRPLRAAILSMVLAACALTATAGESRVEGQGLRQASSEIAAAPGPGAPEFARSRFDDSHLPDDPVHVQFHADLQAGRMEQARAHVISLAELGNPVAQFMLGGFFAEGKWGLPQDDEQAVLWTLKAAEQGLARAQNEMGVARALGVGASQDPEQAAEWFRKAADQDLAVGQANLGVMYWYGFGVRRDAGQAAAWLHKAAGQEFAWAQFYLGMAYLAGNGVTRDEDQAYAWYQKAALQDYVAAQLELGRMYQLRATVSQGRVTAVGPSDALGRAVYWFARAARLGDEEAQAALKYLVVRLPRTRLRTDVDVRGMADREADLVRVARAREYAYVLARSRNWVEVYLEDGHALGFVSTSQWRRR